MRKCCEKVRITSCRYAMGAVSARVLSLVNRSLVMSGVSGVKNLSFSCGRRTRSVFVVDLLIGSIVITGGCGVILPTGNSVQGTDGTQFSGTACNVSYLDADFDYGFDLPASAEMIRTDNDLDAETNALWTVTFDSALVNITTSVQEANPGESLIELVQSADDDALLAGGDLLLEESITLANGGDAYHSVVSLDGLTTSRVQAFANDRFYTVEVIVATDARTDDTDALASDTVLSLCVD